MPQAVTAFFAGVKVLGAIFAAASLGTGSFLVASAVIGLSVVGMRRAMSLKQPGETPHVSSGQVMVRSTDSPRQIVYGETLVGGVITYANTVGSELRTLYFEIVHTGHEIDSFRSWYLDDKKVPVADVDTAGDGSVDANTGGHGYGPVSSTPVLYLRGHLGTSSQAVDSMLDTDFSDIGSNHRHRGCAKTVARLDMLVGAEEVWDGRAPSNISAVIRGKKVYDPRLDSTFTGTWGTGSGAHRVATPSTWAWSRNPALCWADYRIDSDLGPGWATNRINYNSVAIAADACDANVAIPVATTEDRFLCDLVVDTSMEPAEIIEHILASMAGHQRYIAGQWHVFAGVFQATDFTLTEDDLVGPYEYRQQPEIADRYNQVKGSYFDRDRLYKVSQFLTVNDTTTRTDRDNGRVLSKELDLRAVTGEYQAQRLAFRALNQCTNTGILVFPMGYQGMNIRPGDTGTVTITEFGFTSKVFRCVGVTHVDFQGVNLVLKEDSSAAYADPAEGSYGTRTGAGIITFPGTGTAAQVVKGAFASNVTYRQSAAPSSPETGWIWIDTDDLRVYRWSGAAWVQIAADDALLISASAPAQAGADVTSLNANDIIFRQSSPPGSPQAGWIHIDTDDNTIYRYNGASWDILGYTGVIYTTNTASTFTPTWTGFSSDPSGDLSYIDFGAYVVLWAASSLLGTSNATTMTITNLPSGIRPSNAVVMAHVTNAGNVSPGTVVLGSTGTVTFEIARTDHVANHVCMLSTGFTNSGTKGLGIGWLIVYPK